MLVLQGFLSQHNQGLKRYLYLPKDITGRVRIRTEVWTFLQVCCLFSRLPLVVLKIIMVGKINHLFLVCHVKKSWMHTTNAMLCRNKLEFGKIPKAGEC